MTKVYAKWTDGDRAKVKKMVADGLSSMQIGERLGVNRRAVMRFVDKHDLGPWLTRPLARPMPDDFAVVAVTRTRAEIAAHYQAGLDLVTEWCRTAGVAPKTKKLGRPDDYAAVTASMLGREVEALYGIAKDTRRVWDRSVGINRGEAYLARLNGQKSATGSPSPLGMMGHRPAQFSGPYRDGTPAGLAADYLRRYGPVVRCDATGRYSENGTHWRRGSTVLNPDEIMSRAERLGWRAAA